MSWARSYLEHRVVASLDEVPLVDPDWLDDGLTARLSEPLEGFAATLDDTGLSMLLADANGRLLRRWCSDTQTRRRLDKMGTVRGADLSEAAVGTSGLGTPLATGRMTQIAGPEHFLDFYDDEQCVGSPIFDPVTRQMLGAITLECKYRPHSDLLLPLLRAAVYRVDQYLLETSSPKTRRLLLGFVSVRNRPETGVLALSEDIHVATSDLAGSLDAADLKALREMRPAFRHQGGPVDMILSNGERVQVHCEYEDGDARVLRLDRRQAYAPSAGFTAEVTAKPHGRSARWLDCMQEVRTYRKKGVPILVTGEAGSGKLTAALGYPYEPPEGQRLVGNHDRVFDSGHVAIHGCSTWLQRVQESLQQPGLTLVRHLDTLPHEAEAPLCIIAEERVSGAELVATVTGTERDVSMALRQRFGVAVVRIPALRDRLDDISELMDAMLAKRVPSGRVIVISEGAKAELTKYPWPGNVREIDALAQRFAASTLTGAITAEMLPREYRVTESNQKRTLIEKAETAAIENALSMSAGNRVKAAELLGISRATLYRKLRLYQLTDS